MDADRLRLIRFVTARYHSLQGFRAVADGIFLLLMPLVIRWPGHGGVKPGEVVVSTMLFMAAASLVQDLVAARYNRRFGRAGRTRTGDRMAVLLFSVTYATGVTANQLSDAPWLRAAIATVALGAGPLWIVCRDWPYRAHWLLPLAAAIAGGVLFAGVEGVPAIADWSVFVWRPGGLALIAAGLLDHALLVRFMTPDGHDTMEPARS
jgi:hypothetical protein